LKVVTVKIPPLRDRPEDIPQLLKHFLGIYAAENKRENMRFTAEAMRKLVEEPWEGNVRELRNLVESLAVLSPEDQIRVEDLPEEYRGLAAHPVSGRPPEEARAAESLTMEQIERQAILEALEKTGGNRTRAAGMLGIGLRTLQRKLKEYRLAGLD
jgi:DNA-binding NtrC family response regulator